MARHTRHIKTAGQRRMQVFATITRPVDRNLRLLVNIIRIFSRFSFNIRRLRRRPVTITSVINIIHTRQIFRRHRTTRTWLNNGHYHLTRIIKLRHTDNGRHIHTLHRHVNNRMFRLTRLITARHRQHRIVTFSMSVTTRPNQRAFRFFRHNEITRRIGTIRTNRQVFSRKSMLTRRGREAVNAPVYSNGHRSLVSVDSSSDAVNSWFTLQALPWDSHHRYNRAIQPPIEDFLP